MSTNTSNLSLFKFGFSVLEIFPNMYFNLKHQIIPVIQNNTVITIKEVVNKDLSDWIKPIDTEFSIPEQKSNIYQKINEKLLHDTPPN